MKITFVLCLDKEAPEKWENSQEVNVVLHQDKVQRSLAAELSQFIKTNFVCTSEVKYRDSEGDIVLLENEDAYQAAVNDATSNLDDHLVLFVHGFYNCKSIIQNDLTLALNKNLSESSIRCAESSRENSMTTTGSAVTRDSIVDLVRSEVRKELQNSGIIDDFYVPKSLYEYSPATGDEGHALLASTGSMYSSNTESNENRADAAFQDFKTGTTLWDSMTGKAVKAADLPDWALPVKVIPVDSLVTATSFPLVTTDAEPQRSFYFEDLTDEFPTTSYNLVGGPVFPEPVHPSIYDPPYWLAPVLKNGKVSGGNRGEENQRIWTEWREPTNDAERKLDSEVPEESNFLSVSSSLEEINRCIEASQPPAATEQPTLIEASQTQTYEAGQLIDSDDEFADEENRIFDGSEYSRISTPVAPSIHSQSASGSDDLNQKQTDESEQRVEFLSASTSPILDTVGDLILLGAEDIYEKVAKKTADDSTQCICLHPSCGLASLSIEEFATHNTDHTVIRLAAGTTLESLGIDLSAPGSAVEPVVLSGVSNSHSSASLNAGVTNEQDVSLLSAVDEETGTFWKRWKLLNSGTTTWKNVQLELMASSDGMKLVECSLSQPNSLKPGRTLDMVVWMNVRLNNTPHFARFSLVTNVEGSSVKRYFGPPLVFELFTDTPSATEPGSGKITRVPSSCSHGSDFEIIDPNDAETM